MTEPTSERVYLNAETLKGIAHPIRLRLLGLLREDGPSTATKLAERIGQSSGVTSYHLRQLAQFGFVEEATEAGRGGRERWWKSAHRFTTLEAEQMRQAPAESEVYMRAIASRYAERMERWLGEAPMLPREWDEGATLSDFALRLTAAESAQFLAKFEELVRTFRAERPDVEAPEGAERVSVQIQVMPFLRAMSSAKPGSEEHVDPDPGAGGPGEGFSAAGEGDASQGVRR